MGAGTWLLGTFAAMKIGINLPAQFPFDSTQAVLPAYEEAGFDSYWAPDHILGVFHPGLWADTPLSALAADPDAFYDPFCYGARLSAMTDVTYGISVTDSTRRKAADLARTALTLNDMLPGGFILGIGSGEAESLLPFGYPFDKPVALLEECLIELRSLLDTGRMPDGGPGRMGLPLEAEGRGKPPVWVAGHGPRMLRLTGQYGDGWIPAWWMKPEEYGEKREIVNQHAADAGRPAPEAALLPFVLFAESIERAAEMFEAEPLGKLFGLFAMGHIWEANGLEHPLGNDSKGFIDVVIHDLDPDELRDLAPTIPFEMVQQVLFIGNAEELGYQFEAYAKNGLEHMVLANLTGVLGGMDEIMARAMEMPQLLGVLREL
ncbi:MAG: LLM class flavin-dependent oxidoreductase [Actinomycetota bacterium]